MIDPPIPQQLPKNLPHVLVFSEGCISNLHGTGTIFLRNFSAYPNDRLCNAFIGSAESAALPSHIDLNAARWPRAFADQLAALPARIWNHLSLGRWYVLPASRKAIARELQNRPFEPDLIYAMCWGAEGLVALNAVVAAFPETPVLLHVQDFWPEAAVNFRRVLRKLAPRLTALWAISRPIANVLEQTTGRPCQIEPAYHTNVPVLHKTRHRPADADFRAVLIGNIWDYALLDDMKAVWRTCQTRSSFLGPIKWYCHPDAVARIRGAGLEPEPEIEPAGFLTGEPLWEMLADADMGLVPFSHGAAPATDYERYSLPSRLTELAAAGLPIFALTGPGTPLAEYLEEKNIGRFGPPEELTSTAELLHQLVLDHQQRADYGRRARAIAEAEFPLAAYQASLYARFAALAQTGRS